ncbi:MAG: hypothetical protein NC223_03145 [Butyrivibrio sp.]|nr:hypothetical protein [Butyrivibrio sp.]
MIKARVNIETAQRVYKRGEVINEKLSAADIRFLKKHNFIADESEESFSDSVIGSAVGCDDSEILDLHVESSEFGAEYKDEAALKKLNKDEIVEYAAGIGLELESDALKSDLINSVLNYIEECIAEAEEE